MRLFERVNRRREIAKSYDKAALRSLYDPDVTIDFLNPQKIVLCQSINRAMEQAREGIGTKDNQRLVGLREFIDSPDYLDRKSDVWPKIKDELELMCAAGIRGCFIERGIGGAKSYSISLLLLYNLYRFAFQEVILEQNIRGLYELDRDTPVAFATCSKDAKNAKRVVFTYVSAFLRGSPWFREYLPFNPSMKQEISFKRGGYHIFPGHGDQSSVIGLCLHTCAVDEANFFKFPESSEIDYAQVMWEAIDSRITSRFGLAGYLGTISSVRTENDFTKRKKEELQQDPTTAAQYYFSNPDPTWSLWTDRKNEFMPPATIDGEPRPKGWKLFDLKLTKFVGDIQTYKEIKGKKGFWVPEDFWGPFSTNPESALRDHGSIRSTVESPFIRRTELIEPDFSGHLLNPIRPTTKPSDWLRKFDSYKEMVQWFDGLVFPWFHGDGEFNYHFHCDLAKNRDACGLVMAHCSGNDPGILYNQEADSRPERTALIDLDFVCQIKAPPKDEIIFQRVREILYWLRDRREFRIRQSSFDGWQSIDSIQQLASKGFLVDVLSIDKDMEAYTNLKDALYEGRLFFPAAHGQTEDTEYQALLRMANAGDPCAVLQVELHQLMDIDAKKVDHPNGGSKDVSDAAAGAITQVMRHIRTIQ